MRKLGAVILSLGAVYGLTQINMSSDSGPKSVTYEAVSKSALRNLNHEISQLKRQIINNQKNKYPNQEIVTSEVHGKNEFEASYNNTMEWLSTNKIDFRFYVQSSFAGVMEAVKQVQTSGVSDFNSKTQLIVNQVLTYSKSLRLSPLVLNELQKRISQLASPLEVKNVSTIVANTTPRENLNFENLNKSLQNLTQERTVEYQSHTRESSAAPLAGIYLAGLAVGIFGFFNRKKSQPEIEPSKGSEFSDINATMKKVLKELNYPVLICDSNFNITWQNEESGKLKLNERNVQNILSDSHKMEKYELDSRTYTVKVEELKYKSGKVSYILQMIPQMISPRALSNIINSQDIERVMENSLNQTKDFKGLNQLVAENTVRMNYLFKVSAKVIDVDFDENLSECFIESNRLNEAVKEFMMANYHLIKDDSKASGLFLRTSEKGQRFNLNCFIPGVNKDSFAQGEASRNLIQKLSTLESKFNLYYPRVSFRWITSGETPGVDICLSLENKSELESLLKESNA